MERRDASSCSLFLQQGKEEVMRAQTSPPFPHAHSHTGAIQRLIIDVHSRLSGLVTLAIPLTPSLQPHQPHLSNPPLLSTNHTLQSSCRQPGSPASRQIAPHPSPALANSWQPSNQDEPRFRSGCSLRRRLLQLQVALPLLPNRQPHHSAPLFVSIHHRRSRSAFPTHSHSNLLFLQTTTPGSQDHLHGAQLSCAPIQ